MLIQKHRMKDILTDIQSGKFAKEWIEENENDRPNFNRIEQEEAKHQIEEVGQRLRAMMPFVNEGAKTKEEEVVGSAKN